MGAVRRSVAAMPVVAIALASALPAHGQSRRYAPEPEDYDRDSEQHSALWERVVHPDRTQYMNRIAYATEVLLTRRDDRAEAEAEEVLQGAVELAPDQPLALWWLAIVQEHREKWQACADSYGRVFAIDPDYQPPAKASGQVARSRLVRSRDREWALDMGLARCHAHSGEYERAISHYKRILGRGFTDEALVHLHLGEAYMALGRLSEATDALDIAHRLQPGHWRIEYALAAAYDRDEQEARARAMLMSALRHDANLARLTGAGAAFTPPADRLYYLGLAHEARGKTERAIAYFRYYLHVTGSSPWHGRARQHLADLARDPLPSPSTIEVSGTGAVKERDVAAAVAGVLDELHRCVAPVPGVLFKVRVTVLGGRGRGRRRSRRGLVSAPAPGVHADVVLSFATEAEPTARAQQCLESAAETVPLPRPAGGPDRYTTVKFLVIAPQERAGSEGRVR